MISAAYALLAAAASGAPAPSAPATHAAPAQAENAPLHRVMFSQMVIQQRIVIRVPAFAPPPPPPAPLQRAVIVWKEKKGPKCVPMNQLAGASVTRGDSIDLLLRGGRRLRAMLDGDCPAADFYSGFYLTPTGDGQVCSGRDTLHTRVGGKCDIEKFRELVPGK